MLEKFEPTAVTLAREKLYKSNVKSINRNLDNLIRQTAEALEHPDNLEL